MSLERICTRDVVTVLADTTLLEVARLMVDRHVGSVIVIEDQRPVGIVTDRDIVVKAVAALKDPRQTPVHEIMAPNPAMINVNYDPLDATRLMRDRGLRRLPVVDEKRHLLGVITMDDVVRLMGSEIANLAEAIGIELTRETGKTQRLEEEQS